MLNESGFDLMRVAKRMDAQRTGQRRGKSNE